MKYIDKIKRIFQNKEKRVENLIAFLVILVITLIIINKIIKGDNNKETNFENTVGVELALTETSNETISENLEKRLENILSKIEGVGEVSVLITYYESGSIVPMYNIASTLSTTEEKDTTGGTRTISTEDSKKDIITDSSSKPVTEKTIMPKVEGAVIIAKGAQDITVKTNIISAVEAVTGISTHKIQVFEMNGGY